MLTLRSELQSTSIHPATGQAINEGKLLAGTKIYARSSWKESQDGFSGETLVTFRVQDAAGFVGLEQAPLDALEAAL